MRVGQEIDALTVMGIGPIPYLVVPRLVGVGIALPCLTIFAGLGGILGGCLVASGVLDIGVQAYLADSLIALEPQDLWGSVVKSITFAVIIGIVACQQGLDTQGGAEGVGRATTASVVRSIVLILVADLWVTSLLYEAQ
jgi:phospholipid/cholesterol/gamma-HCH transport system permease protein